MAARVERRRRGRSAQRRLDGIAQTALQWTHWGRGSRTTDATTAVLQRVAPWVPPVIPPRPDRRGGGENPPSVRTNFQTAGR